MHEAAATPAWALIAYLVAGVCFILALRGLSSPESSRRGNRLGMVGMAIAVVTTLVTHAIASLAEIAIAIAIGGDDRPGHRAAHPDDGDAATGRRLPQPGRHGGGAGRRGGVPQSRRRSGSSMPSGADPSGQPGRDGPRRRDRRDHLLAAR